MPLQVLGRHVLQALDELAGREVLADLVLGARSELLDRCGDIGRPPRVTLDLRTTTYSLRPMGSSASDCCMELDGVSPHHRRDVWLAPTAVLVGDVRVGDRANIWFGAVLRGD